VKHFNNFFKLLVLNYAGGLAHVQKATALLSSSTLPFNHSRQNRLTTVLLGEWDSNINRLLVKEIDVEELLLADLDNDNSIKSILLAEQNLLLSFSSSKGTFNLWEVQQTQVFSTF